MRLPRPANFQITVNCCSLPTNVRFTKAKAADFTDTKASALGEYVPAKLGMDEGENAVYMVATKDYKGMLLFAFENGKLAKVPLEAYQTKTNRKKLTGAYSDKSPLAGMVFFTEDKEFLLKASSGRMLLIHSGAINLKTTRSTQGVAVMKLKKGHRLFEISEYVEGTFAKPQRYRTKHFLLSALCLQMKIQPTNSLR